MNSPNCWPSSAASTTTNDLTGRYAEPPRPRRSQPPPRPGRPTGRPLPAPVYISRHTVSAKSGNIFVAPYKVNAGLRWAGHDCDVIRDGEHITILSGTALVRTFTADPTRSYQRGDKSTRTYRTREPKPAS